jgi:succinate dehydrogenase/fumarate reductase flavoprotein subunit
VKFFTSRKRWDLEVDVLVAGSGGPGSAAAIVAHDHGASVAILEKSDKFGGATAVSGGVVWIPNNHHMSEIGVRDSREEALVYTRRLADGRSDDKLIELFIDTAPEMIRYIEERTPVRFKPLGKYPDYHPEFEGGKLGGRSLDPGLFDTNELGAWKDKLRKSPIFGMTAMSVAEATEWGVFAKPLGLPYKLLAERYAKGFVCYGGALAGGLLKGLLSRGIEPMLGTAARELILDDGKVIGLRAERAGQSLLIRARKGVVLASGGFEWNKGLAAQFLSGVITHPNTPPSNEGDGLAMAMAAGADLGNMSEAWWCPSVMVPGEEYDGRQLHRGDFAIRSLPHTILVNRKGQRFVNEAQNYQDMMKPCFHFDPVRYDRPNLPAWLILDQNYRDKYMLVTLLPGMKSPDWLPKADRMEDLARQVGIDHEGLSRTVERFNEFARKGVDEDFQRGESAYDHFYGDPDHRPNPNLGTIEKPPFYALRIFPGSIGTKAGPRVNANAEVVRPGGAPIEGLYAAGNVMAGVTGPGYPGAGSTIGTGMTFGFIAGRHAASRKRS